MFIFCFCSRPTLFNIVSKNDLGRLYFYRDFYLYCSRPIQNQYYCIVIVYYCFLLLCWMNIKVEVELIILNECREHNRCGDVKASKSSQLTNL